MKPEEIRLLIAEDDELFRKTICDLFSLFKFDVRGVADGQAAWNEIQNTNFHIVITDIRMPVLSGFDLLLKIKNRNADFPKVIAISGFTDHSTAELYAAGIDGFFIKPFDILKVRQCVSKSLVAPAERWGLPYDGPNPYMISKRFPNLAQAILRGEIFFGRMGFFLPMAINHAKCGELVGFDLSFGGPKPAVIFKGIGQIMFDSDRAKGAPVTGVGIEIMHLNPEAIIEFAELIKLKKSRASIPDGSGL